MSIYAVHKVLHRAQVDLDFRELVRTDPRAAIADFALTDDERTALLAGDVAALARAGVHTFLLVAHPSVRAVRPRPRRVHPTDARGFAHSTASGRIRVSKRWAAVGPGRGLFELGADADQHVVASVGGDELHAARQAVVGPAERE